MFLRLITQNRREILLSISLAALLFLLKFLRFQYMIVDHEAEIYIGFIAVIFTALGVWLTLNLRKPAKETIIIEKQVKSQDFIFNASEAERLGLSKREIEVLELMAAGLSNQEIGERLFLSLNTIKTHSRRIFEKLDAVRRAQAIDKAKRLMIIP